jgi:hypothetical protein
MSNLSWRAGRDYGRPEPPSPARIILDLIIAQVY